MPSWQQYSSSQCTSSWTFIPTPTSCFSAEPSLGFCCGPCAPGESDTACRRSHTASACKWDSGPRQGSCRRWHSYLRGRQATGTSSTAQNEKPFQPHKKPFPPRTTAHPSPRLWLTEDRSLQPLPYVTGSVRVAVVHQITVVAEFNGGASPTHDCGSVTTHVTSPYLQKERER